MALSGDSRLPERGGRADPDKFYACSVALNPRDQTRVGQVTVVFLPVDGS